MSNLVLERLTASDLSRLPVAPNGVPFFVPGYTPTAGVVQIKDVSQSSGSSEGGSSNGTAVVALNQTDHGFAVGSVVYQTGAGTWALARANASATAPAQGIVTAVADADNCTITKEGIADLTSSVLTFVAGTLYYLSAGTAGAYTATAPTGETEFLVPVFRAITTKVIDIRIDWPQSLAKIVSADLNVAEVRSGLAIPVVTEDGTSRTLTLADANTFIRCTAATAVTITVPSLAWPAGAEIFFSQAGAGQITLTASGTTINTSDTLKSLKQHAVIGIKLVATNTFVCLGERAAS